VRCTGYDATTVSDAKGTPGKRFAELEAEIKNRTDDPRIEHDWAVPWAVVSP